MNNIVTDIIPFSGLGVFFLLILSQRRINEQQREGVVRAKGNCKCSEYLEKSNNLCINVRNEPLFH